MGYIANVEVMVGTSGSRGGSLSTGSIHEGEFALSNRMPVTTCRELGVREAEQVSGRGEDPGRADEGHLLSQGAHCRDPRADGDEADGRPRARCREEDLRLHS